MANRRYVAPNVLLNEHIRTESAFWDDVAVASATAQGRPRVQEDEVLNVRHIQFESFFNYHLCGIYDGHGTGRVSEYLRRHMPDSLAANLGPERETVLSYLHLRSREDAFKTRIVNSFEQLDTSVRRNAGMNDSGSTAACCLITPTHIALMNTGDSNIIYKTVGGVREKLSKHTVEIQTEAERVNEAARNLTRQGGRTLSIRNGRIRTHFAYGRGIGSLAMSRSVGDAKYKNFVLQGNVAQPVIVTPEILMYSKGILENFIDNELRDGNINLETICRNLVLRAYNEENSQDNMSITIIVFEACFQNNRRLLRLLIFNEDELMEEGEEDNPPNQNAPLCQIPIRNNQVVRNVNENRHRAYRLAYCVYFVYFLDLSKSIHYVPPAKLFLISTKAGGLGINLFGANGVLIFNASWNPSQDMQSILRVYRFGQDKSCYIYRLIARGTMEEKILRRQITKLSLSPRVVDEHQIERHFKFDDVNEMYVYEEAEDPHKDSLAVPKDRLLADLLMSNREWIKSYEELDSLLENKVEEEKEADWKEFKDDTERKRIVYAPQQQYQDAATSLKIRERLFALHPQASEVDIIREMGTILDFMDKILTLNMSSRSELSPEVRTVVEHLNGWLRDCVGPRQEPYEPPPPGALLLPLPVDRVYLQRFVQIQGVLRQPQYQAMLAGYQQQGGMQMLYQRAPVPPILRAQLTNPGLPQPRMQHIQNNIRNIVATHLLGNKPNGRMTVRDMRRQQINRNGNQHPGPSSS